MKDANLFFHQVGQIWSYRAVFFVFRVANREFYNLSMVSGPVLLKIKGTSWIFMRKLALGGSKNQKKTNKWNEIGQMLVSGALDDTKTIGKVGADIFAKSGPD